MAPGTADHAEPGPRGDWGGVRIYLVNLPLRFNPWQDIGSSYGMTAEQKLQRPILYASVLDDDGFRRIGSLATDALWPYSAQDPADATEAFRASPVTMDSWTALRPSSTVPSIGTASHSRRKEAGRHRRDDAIGIANADAERDQGEHIEMAGLQRG